jgi:hypothetical protein
MHGVLASKIEKIHFPARNVFFVNKLISTEETASNEELLIQKKTTWTRPFNAWTLGRAACGHKHPFYMSAYLHVGLHVYTLYGSMDLRRFRENRSQETRQPEENEHRSRLMKKTKKAITCAWLDTLEENVARF